jgi:glycerol-3-phosphate dehydrogenase
MESFRRGPRRGSVFDVAIIGAGVVGCAIARELSRFRLRVALLEKCAEVGFGTTKTNSGIIHPGHHSPPDTLKGQLAVRGNQLFDALREELSFGFRRIGELVVARTEGDLPALDGLKAQGQKKGVPGLELWDRERLRREEPNLSQKLLAALHAPTAGVINPYEFAFALVEHAVQNGVELVVDAPVERLDPGPDGITVQTPQGGFPARFVVNSAGVFSDQIAAMAGLDDFRILPRKGEEYMLDKRLQGLVRRLVFPVPSPRTKGTLIIPTFDGTIMVGPTAEDTEDRYDVSTTESGAGKVFDFVRQICPAISPRDTIAEFAGLRAVSDTNDFIIGPTRVKGFINVAGIQSPGLTASPAIAEYVRDILKDEGLALEEKSDFRRHAPCAPRFSAADPAERERLVAENPLFAKVVCRCELVTEAEVQDAIDRGARTLDGIKFRTRAGMGRCQGGFCASRCMTLLAERGGVPLHEITKRGNGSWIVAEMANDQHPRAAGADEKSC